MRHSFSAWQAGGVHGARLKAEVSSLQERLEIGYQRVDKINPELAGARNRLTNRPNPSGRSYSAGGKDGVANALAGGMDHQIDN